MTARIIGFVVFFTFLIGWIAYRAGSLAGVLFVLAFVLVVTSVLVYAVGLMVTGRWNCWRDMLP